MKLKILTLSIASIFSISISAQVRSYFPEEALNCIVLLEKKIDTVFVPHGTGFLIVSNDSKKPMIVITNEHVLRNKEIYVTVPATDEFLDYMHKNNIKAIALIGSVWTLHGHKLRHKFELIPNETFVKDEKLDIAAFKIAMGSSTPLKTGESLPISTVKNIPLSSIKEQKEIPLGTDVYFIGFPFSIGTEYGFYNNGFTGLFSEEVPNPLVRKGCVAWTSNNNEYFLLDAFSYSGNSGSPIFTINDLHNKSYLIGIVRGHIGSEKSDNIGLATCVWSDHILKLIKGLK